MKWILILFLSFQALGSRDAHRIPESFSFKFGKAIFVDFQNAHYFITYDLKEEKAHVRAEIEFISYEEGYPIFDSVTDPLLVKLDGKVVNSLLQETPSGETKLRVIGEKVSPGVHELYVDLPLETLVEFESAGVRSAFWTSDLSERNFLERYLPSSFEYDQVKMNFHIEFVGKPHEQKIFTNGELSTLDSQTFTISFPDYFNASSVYFHTVPQSKVVEVKKIFDSIDGRKIPATFYIGKSFFGGELSTLKAVEEEAFKVFHELERDYGPWPHPVLVIYNAGRGGMEYCGATITEFRAIGHEMFHSYFARGVMPANGNAGWMDEALASWRDNGYKQSETLSGSSQMSSHPYYTRTTDRAAYSFGEKFMRLLDYKLQDRGGVKSFLKHMVSTRLFDPLSISDYINEMENYFGENLRGDFVKYTFSSTQLFPFKQRQKDSEYHLKMTLNELRSLL